MEIKVLDSNKDSVCEKILRSLPEWFGLEDSTKAYIDGVKNQPFFAAFEEDKAVGFISLKEHDPKSYEVYVMGVSPEFHGRGIGKQLILKAEEYLTEESIEFLQVKTLSESSKDENYAKTRQFYLSCGFTPLEEFKGLWYEHNPCLLLVKAIKL